MKNNLPFEDEVTELVVELARDIPSNSETIPIKKCTALLDALTKPLYDLAEKHELPFGQRAPRIGHTWREADMVADATYRIRVTYEGFETVTIPVLPRGVA